jgi:hypothetical protein
MNYTKGQTVYIGLGHVDLYHRNVESTRVPDVIESGFDGREWYVYERPSKDGDLCQYDVAPFSAFYDSETAGSNFKKRCRTPPLRSNHSNGRVSLTSTANSRNTIANNDACR